MNRDLLAIEHKLMKFMEILVNQDGSQGGSSSVWSFYLVRPGVTMLLFQALSESDSYMV